MANEKPAGMVSDPGLGAGEKGISKIGAEEPSKSEPSYTNALERVFAKAKEAREQRVENQKQQQKQEDTSSNIFHRYGKFAETKKLAEKFAKGYIEASKNPKYKVEVYKIKEQLKKNPRKFLEEQFPGMGKTEYIKRKALYPLIKKFKKELPYIKSFKEQEKKRRQLKALESLAQKQKKPSTPSTKKIIDLSKQSRRKTSGFSALLQSLRGKKPA